MLLFRGLLFVSAVFAIFISPPAWASKELNIARDGSSDPSGTAVIVTERQAGSGISSTVTWLLHITDLSLPTDKQTPVKLFSVWSSLAGKYPRVSSGSYLLHIGCERGGGGISMKQNYQVTVEAKAGKAYVVGCDGVGFQAGSPRIREVDQSTLPR